MTRFSQALLLAAPLKPALAGLRFLLGVDGGGTGTRVRLTDLQGRVLGQGEAGPSALGQGVAQAWRHVQQAAQAAAQQAGLSELPLEQTAIGLGLSGAGVPAQARDFLDRQPGYAQVALDNDGFTTVLGAHGGEPGGVIASGTGSVGEALRGDGSRVLVGGWGWIGGDEGSGAWLGLAAMRQAQKAQDGRAAEGPLAHAVWQACGALDAQGRPDRDALSAWVAQARQHAYAQLAPLVFEHAAADPAAAALVRDAVAELASVALALDPTQQLPLALCGSIALRLRDGFSGNIRARCVQPRGDSADGALLLVRSAITESAS
ncbi:ATPase [Pelomonas sp. CA6]|uniref:BadF/BadG/BcrA/BcrD ATPase family protein n=1 Tax=Pelomonas sp. CA6 TaxID=2907999 RepID=UPI001F4A3CD4|nr:BadF/BadG/BcrA/BcrD ATPase family protein [Pelomonas sp. CA6]MCH7342973.1 ATPase [Pelomonas sp. CA6]